MTWSHLWNKLTQPETKPVCISNLLHCEFTTTDKKKMKKAKQEKNNGLFIQNYKTVCESFFTLNGR